MLSWRTLGFSASGLASFSSFGSWYREFGHFFGGRLSAKPFLLSGITWNYLKKLENENHLKNVEPISFQTLIRSMTNQDSWVWSTAHQSSANFPDDPKQRWYQEWVGKEWIEITWIFSGPGKKNPGKQKKSLNLHNFSSNLSLKTNSEKISSHGNVTLACFASFAANWEAVWASQKLPGFSRKIMGYFFSKKKCAYSYWKIIKAHGSHDIFRFTKFFGGELPLLF